MTVLDDHSVDIFVRMVDFVDDQCDHIVVVAVYHKSGLFTITFSNALKFFVLYHVSEFYQDFLTTTVIEIKFRPPYSLGIDAVNKIFLDC